MRNKIIFVLLILIGIYFVVRFFTVEGGLGLTIGNLFVATIAFFGAYIVMKKK
jgi:drug/metabolite transporter (DMT)-like permease